MSIFVDQLDESRSHYAQTLRQVGAIDEKTTTQYRQKATQYYQSRQDSGWWRDYSACNLWTAAFFMAMTEHNLQLLPTTAALSRLIRNLEGNCELKGDIGEIVAAANQLAKEKRFFHWALEFPEIFNPPNYELRIPLHLG